MLPCECAEVMEGTTCKLTTSFRIASLDTGEVMRLIYWVLLDTDDPVRRSMTGLDTPAGRLSSAAPLRHVLGENRADVDRAMSMIQVKYSNDRIIKCFLVFLSDPKCCYGRLLHSQFLFLADLCALKGMGQRLATHGIYTRLVGHQWKSDEPTNSPFFGFCADIIAKYVTSPLCSYTCSLKTGRTIQGLEDKLGAASASYTDQIMTDLCLKQHFVLFLGKVHQSSLEDFGRGMSGKHF